MFHQRHTNTPSNNNYHLTAGSLSIKNVFCTHQHIAPLALLQKLLQKNVWHILVALISMNFYQLLQYFPNHKESEFADNFLPQ